MLYKKAKVAPTSVFKYAILSNLEGMVATGKEGGARESNERLVKLVEASQPDSLSVSPQLMLML